jgi:diacylglycerol kinase (ATP)
MIGNPARKKTLVLINPVSGGVSKIKLKKQIEQLLDGRKMDIQMIETISADDTDRLAAEAGSKNYQIVVAAGGDGTISQIARYLIGTEIALGIIPAGSGNGYARSLGIPMDTEKAIQLINQGNVTKVDTGTLNGKSFVNVAGVGFDAHVAHAFQHSVRRGLMSYIQITLTEFGKYKPVNYSISTEEGAFNESAFLISICLGKQYGNNAYIAPQADLHDGLFHATVIRNITLFKVPGIVWKLFLKSIRKSKNMEVFSSANIRIERNEPGAVHLDGDPLESGKVLEFKTIPHSLLVIA